MSDEYPDVVGGQFDFNSPREETDFEALARYANRTPANHEVPYFV
jgi:hypothetical protein